MHSILTTQRTAKEEGRRAQIVAATILTTAELGYANASLAQIAKRAGISTGLILYHFADKEELMSEVVSNITGGWLLYVQSTVQKATTARQKLHSYIESNIWYIAQRPELMAARIEIIFSMRTKNGKLMFETESHDAVITLLVSILNDLKREEQIQDFNTFNTAVAIRATIDQFLGLVGRDTSLNPENYCKELTTLFDRALT